MIITSISERAPLADALRKSRSELLRVHAMPRRRKKKLPQRTALPASELERMIMAPLRDRKTCTKLEGIGFVYVGSSGTEPNWVARTIPSRVSDACRRKFVTAFAAVRKDLDLIPPDEDELFFDLAYLKPALEA